MLALALARVGLSTIATPFVDRARDYANEGFKSLAAEREWRWLFKSATLTTVATQRTYSLASDVSRPLNFINTSDDVVMQMIDVQQADRADPDASETGEARQVFVLGINSTTGYWEVDLLPTPDTSSKTITYRYFAFVEDKTSANDATDLRPTMPEDAQWAIVDYITGRYKGEKGDPQGEQFEMDAYNLKVHKMKRVDGDQDGNETLRMPRRDQNVLGVRFANTPNGTLG
jgi:hypothetical protein